MSETTTMTFKLIWYW